MSLPTRRAAYVQKLEVAVREIIDTLSQVEGVRRVSLFGSYARGRRDLFTDLDVLVVWDTDKGPVERLSALYALLDVPVDLDLFCYTPGEFEAMRDRPFLRHIAADEVVLYEAKSA